MGQILSGFGNLFSLYFVGNRLPIPVKRPIFVNKTCDDSMCKSMNRIKEVLEEKGIKKFGWRETWQKLLYCQYVCL